MLIFQGRGVSLKVKCMHPPEVTFLSTKHSIVALENDTQDFMDKLENFCDVCPKVCDVLEANFLASREGQQTRNTVE